MTWTCPNCDRRYPDSSIGVPKTADAYQMVACTECISKQEPDFGQNGIKIVVGLVDYTERDDDGEPVQYWSTYPISIHQVAQMDFEEFVGMGTEQLLASVLGKYRTEADE